MKIAKETFDNYESKAPKKPSIAVWAEDDRPREKLMRHGVEALSDAELLALLIGSGSPHEDAVTLMQRILTDCGGHLRTLGRKTIPELESYNGIGEAKAIAIIAACELGRRRQLEPIRERPVMNSAQAIYDYMRLRMQDLDVEKAFVLLLNNKFHLLKDVCISQGGISEAAVDVRVIMREAVLNNATQIALCHNHPSGVTRPSREDDRLTQSLKKACDTMRIRFVDHVIVAEQNYYSYMDEGRI